MQLQEALGLDDVLLVPANMNFISSRANVDTTSKMACKAFKMPVVASNMDTVYSPLLAQELAKAGGVACTHRFCSIEDNITLFKAGIFDTVKPWVSIGVGVSEFERGIALVEAGAETVVIDLANGASIQAVEQFDKLRDKFGYNIGLVVGNFATGSQIKAFISNSSTKGFIDLVKIGLGGGAACTSRLVAGVGLPSFTTIQSCSEAGVPMLFDGGIKQPGDFAKALAAGASGIMMGRNFAATLESPADKYYMDNTGAVRSHEQVLEIVERNGASLEGINPTHKKYRGSASRESYAAQGKEARHRAPEGEAFLVEVTGTVSDLMANFEGGLRSSMTYLNATDLTAFRENASFVKITNNAHRESHAHGRM